MVFPSSENEHGNTIFLTACTDHSESYMIMQQPPEHQGEDDNYTDGTQAYAQFYGGPAARSRSRLRSNILQTGKQNSSQRVPIPVFLVQDKTLSSHLSLVPSPTSTPNLVVNSLDHTLCVDTRSFLSAQALEHDESQGQKLTRHRNLSRSQDYKVESHNPRYNPVAPSFSGQDVRVAISSQAPKVEPSQLLQSTDRGLSRSDSTSAGRHPVTIDESFEDARSEVIQRLGSTVGKVTPKSADAKTHRRPSMVTSL